MILEVKIKKFRTRARGAPEHGPQSFHFQKIQGAQILIFYIKEQTQKNKFEIEF